jgi:hypothetical protein
VSQRSGRGESAGAVVDAGQLQLIPDPEKLLDRDKARGSVRLDRNVGLLDSWSDFLAPQFPDGATFFTFTYGDDKLAELAKKRGESCRFAYSPRGVQSDIRRFLKLVEYQGPHFTAVEPHQYRDVLHAHGLLGPLEDDRRHRLFTTWLGTRGRLQLLPATAGAFPYVCKYALKRADGSGDWIDLSGLRRVLS